MISTVYLDELNPSQREAVLALQGPLMIVAGAGSGKTKVLTTRIAHLINSGVDAFRILALTFTNKAAREMQDRVTQLLQNSESKNLYIGTFHSIFARVLRVEGSHLGYTPHFTIYDSEDTKTLLKSIVQDLSLDDKVYKPSLIQWKISAAKNELITAQDYLNDDTRIAEDKKANRPLFGDIYTAYTARCLKNNAMDFDDLLLNMYKLLYGSPVVLKKYQSKFNYVLIDEYQDTNPLQYHIVKLLAALNENICVVGDDAQSIYSFRGATIENILRFQKDYPDARIIKLEQNYRSTQNILEAANSIITHNHEQIPKKLWTEKEEGSKLFVQQVNSDTDEGVFVGDMISEYKLRYHFQNKDFAVLYRTNAQSRSFEESFRRRNIPYVIYGGMSFYQRKEVKDMLAYLRIIVNPHDDEAIKRIINVPQRSIGKTSMERIITLANDNGTSIWNILKNASLFSEIKKAALESVQQFAIMLEMLQSEMPKQNAYQLAFLTGKHSGLVKEFFNDKTPEGLARYENVQELLNSIKEFTEEPDSEDGEIFDKSLSAYLQQIALISEADRDKENQDVVKLMTIHAAKGLEFNNVFVVGLEEGVFPSAMSINSRKELEEERRIFYVAVTRAKQNVWLTHCKKKYRFGELQMYDPSRFLQEIPNSFTNVKHEERSSIDSRYASEKTDFVKQFQKPAASIAVHQVSDHFVPQKDIRAFKTNLRIEHDRFGFGQVASIEGSPDNPIAVIDFDKVGRKKILVQYAKMMLVPI